jgi:PKD repeat protein
MHRFPYRNFGDHETLVGDFTVGGGTGDVGAAIRWFELRNTGGGGWTFFQEGTLDPGDGADRFMGSIGVDQSGDIALGFSVSSTSVFPSIRYATQVPGDPAGTLQPEQVLIDGGGSQTASNRWGDYSAMAVDPVDSCSFWYTNEYYPVSATNAWKTRIGVFQVPSCGPPLAAKANGPYSGTVGTPINFSSDGSTGAIVSYAWDFGDGSSLSNDPNPSHVYDAEGTYTATLTVMNTQGATATDTATVTVSAAASTAGS